MSREHVYGGGGTHELEDIWQRAPQSLEAAPNQMTNRPCAKKSLEFLNTRILFLKKKYLLEMPAPGVLLPPPHPHHLFGVANRQVSKLCHISRFLCFLFSPLQAQDGLRGTATQQRTRGGHRLPEKTRRVIPAEEISEPGGTVT